MRKYFNICNIYILIWCLYFFHWYATGVIPVLESLSNVFLGVNLFISIVATFLVFKERTNRLFNIMGVLVVLFVVYGLISLLSSETIRLGGERLNKGTYMIGPLRTFLPIYTFFLFAKLGYLNEKVIRLWFIPFLMISIYCYSTADIVRYGEVLDDLFTNNTGYLFASLFPFVCFFREKPIIQYAIIAVLFFFSLMALKRGAFLIVIICFLFFIYSQTKSVRLGSKVASLILVALVLYGVWFISSERISRSERFHSRIEQTLEGNDSNRGNLHSIQLEYFLNHGDISTVLFGFGADGTLNIASDYAHNDWIEMLVDQGFLGVSIFFYFWVVFFSTWRKSVKNPLAYNIIGMIFISGLIRTVFSMWCSNSNIFVSLPLGYCLALMSDQLTAKTKQVEIMRE